MVQYNIAQYSVVRQNRIEQNIQRLLAVETGESKVR